MQPWVITITLALLSENQRIIRELLLVMFIFHRLSILGRPLPVGPLRSLKCLKKDNSLELSSPWLNGLANDWNRLVFNRNIKAYIDFCSIDDTLSPYIRTFSPLLYLISFTCPFTFCTCVDYLLGQTRSILWFFCQCCTRERMSHSIVVLFRLTHSIVRNKREYPNALFFCLCLDFT